MAAEEEKNGIEGVATDLMDLLLSNLCKREGSTSLQIDIIGEGKDSEGCKWFAFEEVGRRSVYDER